jgi:hypothetical protein
MIPITDTSATSRRPRVRAHGCYEVHALRKPIILRSLLEACHERLDSLVPIVVATGGAPGLFRTCLPSFFYLDPFYLSAHPFDAI